MTPSHSPAISRPAFLAEVHDWASRLGVAPKRVQVQRLTSKWASCSPAGRLTFSTELLSESERFREEVIVHELLHLFIPNHGKLFRALMRAELRREEDVPMTCRVGAVR